MESRSGKIAITAAIVGLILAASIAMGWGHRDPAPPRAVAPVPDKAAADRLDSELQRCNRLGPDEKPDQGCLDAWAQAQRHFLGGRP